MLAKHVIEEKTMLLEKKYFCKINISQHLHYSATAPATGPAEPE